MDLTGALPNVVIERSGSGDIAKALQAVCPVCNAPIGEFCNREQQMVHAERAVKVFVKEAKKVVGPFGE